VIQLRRFGLGKLPRLIGAATKALETVGFRMLASGLADCIKHPRKSAAEGYSLDQVEKLFLKLS